MAEGGTPSSDHTIAPGLSSMAERDNPSSDRSSGRSHVLPSSEPEADKTAPLAKPATPATQSTSPSGFTIPGSGPSSGCSSLDGSKVSIRSAAIPRTDFPTAFGSVSRPCLHRRCQPSSGDQDYVPLPSSPSQAHDPSTGQGRPLPGSPGYEAYLERKAWEWYVIQPPRVVAALVHALVLLAVYYIAGVTTYLIHRGEYDFRSSETHPLVDALYFTTVTLTTVGYGDITPKSPPTMFISALIGLAGIGFFCLVVHGVVDFTLKYHVGRMWKRIRGKSGERLVDEKGRQFRYWIKFTMAASNILVCILVGSFYLWHVEEKDWWESVYLSIISVTTVGYGDITFQKLGGRIFAIFWIPISVILISSSFVYMLHEKLRLEEERLIGQIVLSLATMERRNAQTH